MFVCLFVCLFVFFSAFFIVNLSFEMFVPVLQLQSKINKVYQTRIRFKMKNLFPSLPLVSTHLTIGLISKVSTRTSGANYTWFRL